MWIFLYDLFLEMELLGQKIRALKVLKRLSPPLRLSQFMPTSKVREFLFLQTLSNIELSKMFWALSVEEKRNGATLALIGLYTFIRIMTIFFNVLGPVVFLFMWTICSFILLIRLLVFLLICRILYVITVQILLRRLHFSSVSKDVQSPSFKTYVQLLSLFHQL